MAADEDEFDDPLQIAAGGGVIWAGAGLAEGVGEFPAGSGGRGFIDNDLQQVENGGWSSWSHRSAEIYWTGRR